MIAVLLLTLPSPSFGTATVGELEDFRYEPDRQKIGRVYHYRKSNIDGTRAGNVDLYIASETRIEAFKWHPGGTEATLVQAVMDWKTFSVVRFETTKLYADGRRRRVATLNRSEDGLSLVGGVTGNGFRAPIKELPWHSYDFDLASLNVSLRYLRSPESTATFGIMDRTTTGFGYKGGLEFSYEANEERRGIPCRRYSIDGPGLEDRGGLVWVRRSADPIIIEYQIDLPDEPGMKSGMLVYLGSDERSAKAWEEHIAACLKGKAGKAGAH